MRFLRIATRVRVRLSWLAAIVVAPFIAALRHDDRSVIVVPPAAPGSLGDEAMTSALTLSLEEHGERVTLIAPGGRRWATLLGDGGPPEARGLTSRGPGLSHLTMLRHAACLYLIGADVLDGKYSDANTKARLDLCRLAARAGVDVRIVSFSMNRRPTPLARRTLQQLPSGVNFVARDPISRDRTRRLVKRKVDEGADLAFLLKAQQLDIELPGRVNIGFSPSRLIAHEWGLDAYLDSTVRCLKALLARLPEAGIVLLPHDRRGNPNDYVLSERIADKLPEGRAVVAKGVRSPGHARSVCAQLDALVACRMHASIGSLGEGTPVIVLDYQDKVEGMLRQFGLEEFCESPTLLRDPERFAERVDHLLSVADEVRGKITNRLPSVLTLAQENLAPAHR